MSLQSLPRQARLVSGLILMVFVTMHLANLAIGLKSLDAMEDWRWTLMVPWQGTPGKILLLGAAMIHTALGLWSLAARRSLVMSVTDMAQLALGLLTPLLMVNHVLTLKLTAALNPDYEPSYGLILAVFWSFAPLLAFQQLFVVVVVWIHAALGLYSWLVLKPYWPRIAALVLPCLFAVPILALLGFVESGKEVIQRLADKSEWHQAITENAGRVWAVQKDIAAMQGRVLAAYAALALMAAAVLAFRILRNRRKPVSVAYDEGRVATGRRGLSVLELSRINHIPHAHVCSGRGRCGTCRIRVVAAPERLSKMTSAERSTLARVQAGPEARLACQALVLGSGVVVERLLPAYADASAAQQPEQWTPLAEAATGAAS